MLITIEKQDVEKAIADNLIGRWMSTCCPVFQALKRAGVPVTSVGNNCVFSISIGSGKWLSPLPATAQSITRLRSNEWESIPTPVTFEYPWTS